MNANGHDSSTSTLVVFCRRPAHGAGKRRIAADIGAELTFALSTHLLATTLEDVRSWPGPVILAPAEAADAAWAGTLLSRQCEIMPQPNGNLGRRINAVDRQARDAGHTDLVFIGSDAPLLNSDYFAQALTGLTAHDVVLGPAEDGGVTLMGARRRWPELGDLPWSSDRLKNALELICIEEGLTVYSLDRRYDIDLATDLPRLYEDLASDPRPARRQLREWLVEAKLTGPEARPQRETGEGKH